MTTARAENRRPGHGKLFWFLLNFLYFHNIYWLWNSHECGYGLDHFEYWKFSCKGNQVFTVDGIRKAHFVGLRPDFSFHKGLKFLHNKDLLGVFEKLFNHFVWNRIRCADFQQFYFIGNIQHIKGFLHITVGYSRGDNTEFCLIFSLNLIEVKRIHLLLYAT